MNRSARKLLACAMLIAGGHTALSGTLGCFQPKGRLVLEWEIPLPPLIPAVKEGEEPAAPEAPGTAALP